MNPQSCTGFKVNPLLCSPVLTFCAFWSCFRTLSINFISDLCCCFRCCCSVLFYSTKLKQASFLDHVTLIFFAIVSYSHVNIMNIRTDMYVSTTVFYWILLWSEVHTEKEVICLEVGYQVLSWTLTFVSKPWPNRDIALLAWTPKGTTKYRRCT